MNTSIFAMSQSESRFSHVKSIHRLLLTYIFLSIVIILFLFSLTIIGLTRSGAGKLIIENAQQITKALAQQSVLALITESPENAASAIQQVLSFPDVVGAGLVNIEGDLLDWQGAEEGRQFFSTLKWEATVTNGQFLKENDDGYWHIAQAVVLKSNDTGSQTELVELNEQRLGFAIVTFSKRNLIRIQRNLAFTISITTLIALVVVPLIINLLVRRMLSPLRALSHVMARNKTKQKHERARVEGAKEFQRIASAFNEMIESLEEKDEKLRNHSNQLEAQVHIRTRQLVAARDAAMNSDRYKSEFLANVTHELRTPIQSIIGYVELAIEEAENEGLLTVQTDLEKVMRNAERLFSLINDVLDISKIEAGKMELKYSDTLISSILSDLNDAVSPLIPQNNNQFSIRLRCDDSIVRIDREKVLQILINLVSNACKFTENGNIILNVSKQSHEMTFEVCDTGIGIPADNIASIFDKFQQVDGSETRKAGGTGLGLAISQQFCELMNGELTVQSEVGKGTCFTLKVNILDVVYEIK